MDSGTLWLALACMLVIEGLLPFFSPSGWRSMFEQILRMSNGQIRFFGLCSMAAGLVWILFLL
ncbi:DUF2065 domain-containing protein [Polaromonas sp. A23]|uniref:DUF2065 domain-containing protein n=1 Tax=Polaromonas sp. A23 TaxID=1944133 RepID=UPI000986AD56|nr:DUF2065 domain-containing protein [Polaromonas sp. A23]OOG37862.1 DUF2065 domain-containing protein [Polaromonas sp. A23]